ncbi:unnamed protein product [Cunninghamella blakesleeana]
MTTSQYNIDVRFCRALAVVQTLPLNEMELQPIPADKLKFYGLYKQATQGECDISKPSSRKVVEYAKWRAWYNVRNLSSLEAKNLYVNALIELLVEFVNRHPNSQYLEVATKALDSLDVTPNHNMETLNGQDFYMDKINYPSDHFQDLLTHIEPQELSFYTHVVTSPTNSYFSQQASIANESLYSATPSLNTSVSTYNQYHQQHSEPRTPLLSPQQYIYGHSKKQMNVYPTSATSSSGSSQKIINNNDVILNNLPSLSPPSLNSHQKKKNKVSEKALENLQTEVTALSEQIDRLTKDWKKKELSNKRYSPILWLIKAMIKHVFTNSIIFGIIISILWYRESPVAISFVNYMKYQFKLLIQQLVRKTMFWKLTV